jgi:hypothetical protein
MLRDLFEVVIRLGSLMSPEFTGFLDRFRVGVTVHVNTGPMDPTDEEAILKQVEAGILSLETALAQLGVEDVGAEMLRLERDPRAVLTLLTKQFTAMGLGTAAGLQLLTVAKLVKFNEEQLQLVEEDATAFSAVPENTGLQGHAGAPPLLGVEAPRPMVPVRKLAGGDLIGEIVTDPQQVTVPPISGGKTSGEITDTTLAG